MTVHAKPATCTDTLGWCNALIGCICGERPTYTRADDYDPPPPDTYADDRAADRAADKEQERREYDWRKA